MKQKNLYKYVNSFEESVLFKAGYNIKDLFVFKSEGDAIGIKTQIWFSSKIAQGMCKNTPLLFRRTHKTKRYPQGKLCEFREKGNWVRGNSEDYLVVLDMGLKFMIELFITRNKELDIKPSRRSVLPSMV